MSQQHIAGLVTVLRAYLSLALTLMTAFWNGDMKDFGYLLAQVCSDPSEVTLCLKMYEVYGSFTTWWNSSFSWQNITVGTIVVALVAFAQLHTMYLTYGDTIWDYVMPRFLRLTERITMFHYMVVSPTYMAVELLFGYFFLPLHYNILLITYLASTFSFIFLWPSEPIKMANNTVKTEVRNGTIVRYVVVDGRKFYENTTNEVEQPRKEMATGAKTNAVAPPKYLGYICSINQEGQYVFHGNFILVGTSSSHYVVTNEHVLTSAGSELYAVKGTKAVKLDYERFIKFASDAVLHTVPAFFAARLGMSPTTPIQLNLKKAVTIVYGSGEDKFYTSIGQMTNPLIREKYVYDAYYSSIPGSSGSAVLQDGRVVGIHCGARGFVDGHDGPEARNYFISLYHFVARPRSKHLKLESKFGSTEDSWSVPSSDMEYHERYQDLDEDYEEYQERLRQKQYDDDYMDSEELLSHRTERARWADFNDYDQDALDIGGGLWDSNTTAYREFERDMIEHDRNGLRRNDPAVRETMQKYAAKLGGKKYKTFGKETNLRGRVLNYQINEVKDFPTAGDQPAEQGKLGLTTKRSPTGTAQTSNSSIQAAIARFGKAHGQ